jgi:O-antigen/teichoic acid export membrane protein
MADDASDSRSRAQEVATGSGELFSGSIVGKVLSTVLQLTLTNVLGAAAYGAYTLGLTVLKFGRKITSLGLQGGIVRFGAEAYGKDDLAAVKGTFISSIVISAGSGAAGGLACYLGRHWIARVAFDTPKMIPVLEVFSLALPFFVVLAVLSRAARALQRMRYDIALDVIVQPALNLLFVAGAFGLGYRLGGATVAFTASMVGSVGLGLYLIGRIFPVLFSGAAATFHPGRLLRYSLPVMGAGLSALVLNQADRLMLGFLASTKAVGIYNVAAIASTQIRFVLSSVNASFTPVISDLYHRGAHAELAALYKTTTRWILTLSLPLAGVLLLFPTPIMQIFGAEYAAGALPLMVLALAFFADGTVGAAGFMLQMSDHERIAMANNVVMAILNIVLNLWLISLYGAAGAALATGLSIVIVNAAKLVEVWALLGMQPYQWDHGTPFLAGAVAAGAGWGLNLLLASFWWGWVPSALVFGLVYLGGLLLLGLNEDDRRILKPLLAKVGLSLPDRPM